jgi:uncharacterized Ntn-hydrolase superfamily protein
VTFSLVGRCERTGAVGAVIASASMAVTARCAAVRAGVGAVCSQSTTDPRLRGELLDAMAGGVAASDALAALVDRTADVAYRQLAVVGAAGGAASYSGELALGEATDIHAAGAAAAGNLLADNGVPAAMLTAFHERAGDDLGARLTAALQAGLAAGGEVSPVRSAGMLIAESEPWPVTDLRVDWHDDPIGQLAGLWQIWQPQAASYIIRALRPSEVAELCAGGIDHVRARNGQCGVDLRAAAVGGGVGAGGCPHGTGQPPPPACGPDRARALASRLRHLLPMGETAGRLPPARAGFTGCGVAGGGLPRLCRAHAATGFPGCHR